MAEVSPCGLLTSPPGSASGSFDKESHPTLTGKSCESSQVEQPPQPQGPVHMYDGGKEAWMTVTGT